MRSENKIFMRFSDTFYSSLGHNWRMTQRTVSFPVPFPNVRSLSLAYKHKNLSFAYFTWEKKFYAKCFRCHRCKVQHSEYFIVYFTIFVIMNALWICILYSWERAKKTRRCENWFYILKEYDEYVENSRNEVFNSKFYTD